LRCLLVVSLDFAEFGFERGRCDGGLR
jgi:hypothetical protein